MSAKSVTLVAPFNGLPSEENFLITDSQVPPLQGDGIQVALLGFSPDPYMRGSMKSKAQGGSLEAGAVITGFVVGKVTAVNGASTWVVGDLFGGSLPFTTVQTLSTAVLAKSLLWKLSDYLVEAEISKGLGVLGMPGSTAYGGLIDILRPVEGETIFVSAASGAVGGLVGQLAKNVYKCKTVGSCGGPAKVSLITEKFGYDAAIDYKTVKDKVELQAKLKEAAPEGIDMYFENVGGMHFNAAFDSLRRGGRIAICGGISTYHDDGPSSNSVNIMQMIYSFQRMEGFMCMPWLSGQKGSFLKDMHKYWREGQVQVEETVFSGIENWAPAFQSLFTGANTGKVVLML